MLDLRSFLGFVSVLLAGCAAPPAASPASSPPPEAMAFARWDPPKLDVTHRATFDRLVPKLDTLFTSLQRESHAPGMAVGIVLGGEIVYAKGFGVRDVEQKTPFEADTPFPIASVTKGFTAMAILKLRDEGRLDLDAPASRYYPPIGKLAPATRDAPAVTLRHLLTHASGLPEDNLWADVAENLSEPDLAPMMQRAARCGGAASARCSKAPDLTIPRSASVPSCGETRRGSRPPSVGAPCRVT